MTRRLCHAIDLATAPGAIAAYEARHAAGGPPPAINANIRAGGIVEMEIYRVTDRLFMIMEVDDDYDPVALARADVADPAISAWASEMAALQRPIVGHQSWAPMTCIYRLSDQP